MRSGIQGHAQCAPAFKGMPCSYSHLHAAKPWAVVQGFVNY